MDVMHGCLGASCSVGTDDWSFTSTVHPTAEIVSWSSGSKDSTDFDYAGRALIKKDGKTQIKLRFNQFQNNVNWIAIYGCNSSSRAVLHVLHQ